MRGFIVLSAALLTAVLVYGVPVSMELEMLRWHANPWLVCVLFADFPGCAFLFVLGFRSTALIVYLLTTAVEASALFFGWESHQTLLWTTNVVPAVVSGAVMFRIALRWTVLHEEGA
jgi:hypothetical protein